VFNHAITYVPSLDLYLDSTASDIAAGYLPPGDLDKPTLLTKLGILGHTPATQLNANTIVVTARLKQDGDAIIDTDSQTLGAFAEVDRYRVHNMSDAQRAYQVVNILWAKHLHGQGSLDLGSTDSTPDEQQVKLHATVDEFAPLPGPAGIATLSALTGGTGDDVQVLNVERTRTQPFVMNSAAHHEIAHYVLPADTHVLALPKPVTIDDNYFHYTADYRQDGTVVTIDRTFEFKQKSHMVFSPSDFTAFKPTLKAIQQDLNRQILVSGNE
jgi:hypothetical protein